jgi:hypothetical protein
MTRVLTMGMFLSGLGLLGAQAVRQQPQLSTTDHADFAPGGTIRMDGSYGCLSVEGWDKPEVEVTVIRYPGGFYAAAQREAAVHKLEAFKIKLDRRSDKELAITTERPRGHLFSRLASNWEGVDLEYMIRVPRDSHVAIHHGGGTVMIAGVTGEIEATAASGDIVALLSDPGPYAIDAKVKLGTIYSDFGDAAHAWYQMGERFASTKPAPARRVYLRTGIGGIEIQEMSAPGL